MESEAEGLYVNFCSVNLNSRTAGAAAIINFPGCVPHSAVVPAARIVVPVKFSVKLRSRYFGVLEETVACVEADGTTSTLRSRSADSLPHAEAITAPTKHVATNRCITFPRTILILNDDSA